MRTVDLTSTPGFAIYDLADADGYAGEIRLGPKLIANNAVMGMRHQTYVFAALGMKRSGASVGLKSEPADAQAAVDAVAQELEAELAAGPTEGGLTLDAGLRLNLDLIASITKHDNRNPIRLDDRDGVSFGDELIGVGAAAAAGAVASLASARVAIANFNAAGVAIAREVAAAGGVVTAISTSAGTATGEFTADALSEAWATGGADCVKALAGDDEPAKPWAIYGADAEVVFCGGAPGALSGDGAQMVGTTPVVSFAPAAVSAKALAVLRGAGATAVPEFVTCIGPTLASAAPLDATHDSLRAEVATKVAELVGESVQHDDGCFMGACYAAEAFMSSWVDELPFGRPMG